MRSPREIRDELGELTEAEATAVIQCLCPTTQPLPASDDNEDPEDDFFSLLSIAEEARAVMKLLDRRNCLYLLRDSEVVEYKRVYNALESFLDDYDMTGVQA